MKKALLIYLFVAVSVLSYSQTEVTPIIRSYVLDAEDCNDGQFYIGEFAKGKYEISANVQGTHANNRGWIIIIGKNYGIGSPNMKIVYNNIGGRFLYKQTEENRFHLWWDSEFHRECDYMWTPFVKVEYETGEWIPTKAEPSRNDGFLITSYTETADLSVGESDIDGKYGSGNKLIFGGTDSNTDPTEMYRYAVSKDVTQLRVRIGDGLSNTDKFIIGSSGNNAGAWTSSFTVTPGGRVGIKTENPSHELDVNGTIRAKEIKVEAQTADFVFEDNYPLKDLNQVEEFIKQYKHLPNIPSAPEMEASGVNLAEMNKLLLQKIEELTLYIIQQQKDLKAKSQEIEELKEVNVITT
ncbi:hypothetical protein BY457_1211 [Marinilabilia salmonicolor]|jgi:hypothetical protein|uniref:hypothetical protein n=1 Tax=Marinilabilia salmonicolor TaxID=989 RepID=UPI000D06F661|nr:hypothetical protein [Marinilabilia salmonicolor]PRY93811.1 hypothetical protein BY457_1211 [Marinilabilia salmonicolor]